MAIFREEGLFAFRRVDAAKILVEKGSEVEKAEVIGGLMAIFRKKSLSPSEKIEVAKILVEKGSEAEKAEVIEGLIAVFRKESLSVSEKIEVAKILIEKDGEVEKDQVKKHNISTILTLGHSFMAAEGIGGGGSGTAVAASGAGEPFSWRRRVTQGTERRDDVSSTRWQDEVREEEGLKGSVVGSRV